MCLNFYCTASRLSPIPKEHTTLPHAGDCSLSDAFGDGSGGGCIPGWPARGGDSASLDRGGGGGVSSPDSGGGGGIGEPGDIGPNFSPWPTCTAGGRLDNNVLAWPAC